MQCGDFLETIPRRAVACDRAMPTARIQVKPIHPASAPIRPRHPFARGPARRLHRHRHPRPRPVGLSRGNCHLRPLPLRPSEAGPHGVQIFFVTGGYLITTLLLRESDRTGSISPNRFCTRRCLRSSKSPVRRLHARLNLCEHSEIR